MPRTQDAVERAARDRLHRLRTPGLSEEPKAFELPSWAPGSDREPAGGAAVGWVPDPPDVEEDIRDVVARLRAGAMATAAAGYTAAHGHPLEHPHPDASGGRRRWHLSVRLAVVAGIAIAVLGAGVAARASLAAPSTGVADLPTPAGPASGTATPGGVDPELTPAPSAGVVVHVVGQVAQPGVVELPAGSRVSDVVAAAGGATPGADLGALNLARVVGDGEQIVVPAPGEVVGGTSAGRAVDGGSGKDPPVDLNAADLAALDALPGIGPVLAQRVLDWRAEHGRFTEVTELGEVPGIGDTLLGRLRDLVRV